MPCVCESVRETPIRRRRSPSSVSPSNEHVWRRIQAAVALTFAVPVIELQASTRCRGDAALARQVTMYIARVVLRMPYAAVSRLCRRDHRTVAHACRVVEQRREDPALNGILRVLEGLCAAGSTSHASGGAHE